MNKLEEFQKFISDPDMFMENYNKDKFLLFSCLNKLNQDAVEVTTHLKNQITSPEVPDNKVMMVYAKKVHTLGLFLFDLEEHGEANIYLSEAVIIYESLSDKIALAKAYNDLAENLLKSFTFEKAKKYYMSAIRIMWLNSGEHVNTAEYINNLGHYFVYTNDYKRAEHLYRRALQIREKILDQDHKAIAEGYYNIGFVYVQKSNNRNYKTVQKKEDCQKGIKFIKKAVDKYLSAGRYIDKDLALYTMALADAIIKENRNFAAAIPYIKDSLAINIALFGINHDNTKETLRKLEWAFFELNKIGGRLDKSHAGSIGLDRAIERRYPIITPGDDEIFMIRMLKAVLLLYRKNIPEAKKEVYKIRNEMEAANIVPRKILNFLKRQTVLFLQTGNFTECKVLLQNILDICRNQYGLSDKESLDSLSFFVKSFLNLSMEEREKAVDTLDDIISFIEEIFESNDIVNVSKQTFRYSAIAYNEVAYHKFRPDREWENSEKYFSKAIELFENVGEPVEFANLNLNLQTVYHFSKLKQVDLQLVKECTEILKKADDNRYTKGIVILKEMDLTSIETNKHKWLMLNLCFAFAFADKVVDPEVVRQIELYIKADFPEAVKTFMKDIERRIVKTGIDKVLEELIYESINTANANHYSKEHIRHILIQLLILSKIGSHHNPRQTYVIQKFAAEFGFNLKEINELRRYIP
ncbi:MAG: tetratricopeptide repeat protein [Bacteroidales bacterium]|nr:tetratricopeptide repeat protein [Bacteroidales bacterium]